MFVGAEIKDLRISMGLSQREMGALVGVSVRTIRRWERSYTLVGPVRLREQIHQLLAERRPSVARDAYVAGVMAGRAHRDRHPQTLFAASMWRDVG